MIQPEEIQRDSDGMWTHSAWEALFDDRDYIDADELDEWCVTHQLVVETRTLEEDPDSPLIAQLEACAPVDLSAWPLQPPSEDPGWFLLAIIDTEDGPVQTWAYSDTKATEGADG